MSSCSSPTLLSLVTSTATHSRRLPVVTLNNIQARRRSVLRHTNNHNRITKLCVSANDVSSVVTDSVPAAELTWQIVVGALAGVTPFVVAGFEFSKRIIAQKRCEMCNGSGLVREDQDYFRCPQCGGFLPWQSWKRFFTG